MPCRDDYPENYSHCDIQNAQAQIRAELEPLLCEACGLLENNNMLTKLSKPLLTWYDAHCKREVHRVAYEAALKLTEKERKALGIDFNALKLKAGK